LAENDTFWPSSPLSRETETPEIVGSVRTRKDVDEETESPFSSVTTTVTVPEPAAEGEQVRLAVFPVRHPAGRPDQA
jgi:hypothetical protein